MKTVISVLLIIMFNSLQAADSSSVQISLHTYLEQDPIPLNHEVVYQVELSWEGDLQRYHIARVNEPVLTNLNLRGSGSSNQFHIDDQGLPRSVKRITYYFTPVEMGMAYIDGISVQYEDTQNNQKQVLTAQRLGVKIIQPVDEPGAGADMGTVLIVALAVIFIAIVVYFLLKYFKIKKAEQLKSESIISVEQKYLEQLSAQQKPENGDVGPAFDKIVRILKHYFAEKYEIGLNSDFEEIRPFLEQAEIESPVQEKLKEMYQRNELSKFADEKISETEFHLYADTAEMILKKFNELRRINES